MHQCMHHDLLALLQYSTSTVLYSTVRVLYCSAPLQEADFGTYGTLELPVSLLLQIQRCRYPRI